MIKDAIYALFSLILIWSNKLFNSIQERRIVKRANRVGEIRENVRRMSDADIDERLHDYTRVRDNERDNT